MVLCRFWLLYPGCVCSLCSLCCLWVCVCVSLCRLRRRVFFVRPLPLPAFFSVFLLLRALVAFLLWWLSYTYRCGLNSSASVCVRFCVLCVQPHPASAHRRHAYPPTHARTHARRSARRIDGSMTIIERLSSVRDDMSSVHFRSLGCCWR